MGLSLGNTDLAMGQEAGGPLRVTWYQPVVEANQADNTGVTVVLSGRSQPQSRISISGKKLTVLREQRILKLPLEEALLSKAPIIARDDGYFEVRMKLPKAMRAQIPVRVESPSSDAAATSKEFLFALQVTENEAKMKGHEQAKESPFLDRPQSLWFGAGFNFVQYDQTLSVADVSFQNLEGPSFFVEWQGHISKSSTAMISLKTSPGSATSSENIQVKNGAYQWLTGAAEVRSRPENWTIKYRNQDLQFGVQGGFQHHVMPFLKKERGRMFKIDERSLTMVSLGASLEINPKERIYFQNYFRFQYPLASQFNFRVQPNLAFDGSVGAIYRLSSRLRLGLYWYGQWLDYSFTETNISEGSQFLFYSNIELRLGWYF